MLFFEEAANDGRSHASGAEKYDTNTHLACSGCVIVAVTPRSVLGLRVISPARLRIVCRAMVSPMPRPTAVLVVVNGSKSVSAISGAIPVP